MLDPSFDDIKVWLAFSLIIVSVCASIALWVPVRVIVRPHSQPQCSVADAERHRLERFNVAMFDGMERLLARIEALLEQHSALSDGEFAALLKGDSTLPHSVCFQMRRHQRDKLADFSALDALVEHLTRLVQKNLPTAQLMLGGLTWSDYPLIKSDAAVTSYSEWH